MSNPNLEQIAAIILCMAVFHSFLVAQIRKLARKCKHGSPLGTFLHLMSEIEIVFGFWAAIFLLIFGTLKGKGDVSTYVNQLEFKEPLFVFAIMTVAATRPILNLAEFLIRKFSHLIPVHSEVAYYFSCLSIGTLLASFITEPAAMTVVALLMKDRYFDQPTSRHFKYITLAVLFVNISIGGVLTPYAAPPILMVASKWNWDLVFMLKTFGWKVAIAILINASLAGTLLKNELKKISPPSKPNALSPFHSFAHLFFLVSIVLFAKNPVAFLGIFALLVGFTTATRENQSPLKFRESFLVGFFLAGLVVLGGYQRWWLEPLLHRLNAFPLFLGATALTSITDNAALTYLGSQVENISEAFKYALVAGAIAGGGLTVIANAPNPAGYSILLKSFGTEGIRPLFLFGYALLPTIFAMICLWYMP